MPLIDGATYSKLDGLSIVLHLAAGTVEFQGQQLAASFSSSAPTFTFQWPKWGQARFELRPDGTLLEGGGHVWTVKSAQPAQPAQAPVPCSQAQLAFFRDTGFLPLHTAQHDTSGALASASVQQAIADSAASAESWHTSLSQDAAVLALAAPFWPTVCAVLGGPVPPPKRAQIAIKSGRAGAAAQRPGQVGPDAHLDGLPCPSNPGHPGEVRNFSLLLGVALTDQPAPNAGNLAVIPGSHIALAKACQRAGAEAAVGLLTTPFESQPLQRLSALLASTGGLAALAPPLPLCLMAGSGVLAHYQTIHFVQPNTHTSGAGQHRVMVYFRVNSPLREPGQGTRTEALEHCFLEMPGLPRAL